MATTSPTHVAHGALTMSTPVEDYRSDESNGDQEGDDAVLPSNNISGWDCGDDMHAGRNMQPRILSKEEKRYEAHAQ